ncbi:MAG: hypothetical protein JSV54_07765 [Chloroflexota bacterium]|nr:MAG: hypothetical protein JSV54_07765 [Chloroflexota bacterium]
MISKDDEQRMDDRVNKGIRLSNSFYNKIDSLGIKPRTYSGLGADISDIYIELEKYSELVKQLLNTDTKDLEAIGDVLIGIKTSLQHINWHIKESRRPLERLIDYCFKDQDE